MEKTHFLLFILKVDSEIVLTINPCHFEVSRDFCLSSSIYVQRSSYSHILFFHVEVWAWRRVHFSLRWRLILMVHPIFLTLKLHPKNMCSPSCLFKDLVKDTVYFFYVKDLSWRRHVFPYMCTEGWSPFRGMISESKPNRGDVCSSLLSWSHNYNIFKPAKNLGPISSNFCEKPSHNSATSPDNFNEVNRPRCFPHTHFPFQTFSWPWIRCLQLDRPFMSLVIYQNDTGEFGALQRDGWKETIREYLSARYIVWVETVREEWNFMWEKRQEEWN